MTTTMTTPDARPPAPQGGDVDALASLIIFNRYGKLRPEIDMLRDARAPIWNNAYDTAQGILASDWLAARDAEVEQAVGLRFRVETACDGYANLMDDDVPSDCDDYSYQQGAHDAAEAIRSVIDIARAEGA